MTTASLRRGLGAAIVALAAALIGSAASAAPQITVPACDGLTAWAATVDPADTYTIAPALPLPKALSDDRLVPVFDQPALAWTGEDIKAASGALTVCYKQAKKAADKPAMDALGVANAAVAKTLAKSLAAIAKARQTIDAQQASLAGLSDSAELDRGLAALIAADPAAPNLQAAAGLPREIVGPLGYIAKFLPYLPDGDREELFAGFAERRASIQAAAVETLGAELAAAPATSDGVIALLQLRQRISAMQPGEALASIESQAASRITEIRTALLQASPAGWVAPDCSTLYGWSGAADAQQTVRLGSQATQAAFLDERAVPAFGISVGRWSDEDIARFQTLRATCQATWRSMPGADAIRSLPADAPELLKLAAAGAWIDTADQQVVQARGVIQAYTTSLEALAALEGQIAALPDAPASLAQLSQMQNDPAQHGVDDARRQAFQAAIAAKRDAINAGAMTAAMDGLGSIEVAGLGDLVKLVAYANTTVMSLPDPNAQQRFYQAVEIALQQKADALLPDFKARLAEMPDTLAGFAQVRTAAFDLTGVSGTEEAPPFHAMHAAIDERSVAIIQTMRVQNCVALLEELDMDEEAAEQLVWDGDAGTALGAFVCGLTESGSPVHEYAGGGMFSGEQTLKATLALGGLQTLWLHEAEVAQGKEMLVGFKMADANQERPISVQEWAMFTAMSTGGRFVTPEMCQPIMTKPEDQLTVEERMIGVDCAEEIVNRSWGFQ